MKTGSELENRANSKFLKRSSAVSGKKCVDFVKGRRERCKKKRGQKVNHENHFYPIIFKDSIVVHRRRGIWSDQSETLLPFSPNQLAFSNRVSWVLFPAGDVFLVVEVHFCHLWWLYVGRHMGPLPGDSGPNISYFGIILSYWPHNLHSYFCANKFLNLKSQKFWPHFKI